MIFPLDSEYHRQILQGGGLLTNALKKMETEGASLNSGSSLFHSDKQLG